MIEAHEIGHLLDVTVDPQRASIECELSSRHDAMGEAPGVPLEDLA
jgi:hypothetical protein